MRDVCDAYFTIFIALRSIKVTLFPRHLNTAVHTYVHWQHWQHCVLNYAPLVHMAQYSAVQHRTVVRPGFCDPHPPMKTWSWPGPCVPCHIPTACGGCSRVVAVIASYLPEACGSISGGGGGYLLLFDFFCLLLFVNI